jgi:hypothetical protein
VGVRRGPVVLEVTAEQTTVREVEVEVERTMVPLEGSAMVILAGREGALLAQAVQAVQQAL